jgi:hypothetical protein
MNEIIDLMHTVIKLKSHFPKYHVAVKISSLSLKGLNTRTNMSFVISISYNLPKVDMFTLKIIRSLEGASSQIFTLSQYLLLISNDIFQESKDPAFRYLKKAFKRCCCLRPYDIWQQHILAIL